MTFWDACIGRVETVGLMVGGDAGAHESLLSWLTSNSQVTELVAGPLEDAGPATPPAGSADGNLRGVG